MSTLADLVLRENENRKVDLDTSLGLAQKNTQTEDKLYATVGEIGMTYDALTSDGSETDNFKNTWNQERLGYDVVTGAPKETEMVPGLIAGAGVYKAAELATVGIVNVARAGAAKAAEQTALRLSKEAVSARKVAAQRTANLFKNKQDKLGQAVKNAKKNKYEKQKQEYYKQKAGSTFAKGAGPGETIQEVAGEIAGNVAMPVMYAHKPVLDKETGDYTQYSDKELVGETIVDLGAMALPIVAGSRMFRSYKKAKTLDEATTKMDDGNWATTVNLDKNGIESINKHYGNSGKKIDDNGFIVVNDLSTTEGSHGAFIDANTGEFRVSSEYAGEVYGSIAKIKGSEEGRLIVDEAKSNINKQLFVDDYKGERAAGFVEADKVIKPGESTKEYTSGKSVSVKEDGSIKANSDLQNRFKASEYWDKKKSDEENYTVLDEQINRVREGKSSIFGKEFEKDVKQAVEGDVPVGFKGMKFSSDVESEPTLEGQRILTGTGGSKNKVVNKVAGIIGDKNLKNTINVSSLLKNHIRSNKNDYTFSDEYLSKNKHIKDIYNLVDISDGKGTKFQAAHVNTKVLEDMQTAIDIAIAKAQKVDSGILAKDVEGTSLAKSAVDVYKKLHNIKPKQGTNAKDLNDLSVTLESIAKEMLKDESLLTRSEKDLIKNGKNLGKTYTIVENSRAYELEQAFINEMDNQSLYSVDQVVSQFMRELDPKSKDVPVITKSGSNKMAKIKDDYSNVDGPVDLLTKHQASMEFHVNKDGLKNYNFFARKLKEFKNKDNEDILELLNGGEKPKTFNERKMLESEVDKLDRLIIELNQNIRQVREIDGVMKFPVEVGKNLRALYNADFSPMNNKIVRSIIVPKTDAIPFKGNENFIKRSLLTMIDASITKDGKKYKVISMTDAEVDSLFQKVLDDGIDGHSIEQILADDMLKFKMSLDAEGFHSNFAFEALKQVKDGKENIDLLVEVDGINNGYMFQELFAGNFNNKSVGLDVADGLASVDNLRQFLLDMISNIKDTIPEGPARAIADNIKPIDIKPSIFTKMYSGGLEVASDAMGSFMFDKFIKNLHSESDPFVKATMDLLDTIAGKDLVNIERINNMLDRKQIISDEIQSLRYEMSRTSGKKFEKVKQRIEGIEAENKALNNDLSKLTRETNNVADIASAYKKIREDARLSRKSNVSREDIQDVLLTPEEVVAVKEILKRDAEHLVEKTINRINGKPEDLGFKKGTPEYDAQMKRYTLAKTMKKFNDEMMVDFALIMNDKSMVPVTKYSSTISEIAKYIKEAGEDLDINVIEKNLLEQFNKHGKSMSMNDVLNAVIHAGYKASTVGKKWKLLDSHIPYIETFHGEKARLVSFESRMGMVKNIDGKAMNYENIIFRPNNSPIPVLATDSGVMGRAIGDSNVNVMSILDAIWGGGDVKDIIPKLNEAVADIGKNYNFYTALNHARSRIKAIKKDNLSEMSKKDAYHFLARSNNRSMKQDHMKLVDEAETKINNYSKSTDKVFEEELNTEAYKVNKLQESLPDDWSVQNYSIGSKDGIGKAALRDDRFYNKGPEVKSNVQRRNYDNYKNVDVIENVTTEKIAFGRKDSLIGKGSNNVEIRITKDKNSFDADSNTILLNEPTLTERGWFLSNHEVGHKASYTLSETAKKALEQFIRDYMVKGKITGKKRDWNSKGNPEVDVVVYVLDKNGNKIKNGDNYVIDFEETMSSMAEVLMANEGLLSQPELFASKWGKVGETFDIASVLEKQYLEISDNVFGKTRIHTMDQLIDHLSQVSKDNSVIIDAFKEWKSNHTVAYNSSTSMKAWINGYEVPKWTSTLKVGSEKQRNYDKEFKENWYGFASNALKQNAHIGSLFYVNDKLEALNKIAAISQGFDATHNSMVANIKKELVKMYKENSGGKDYIEIDKAHGEHVSLGLHHLLDELDSVKSYDDLVSVVEQYDVTVKNNKLVENVVNDIIESSNGSFKDFSKTEKTKLVKSITREIVDLAYGRDATRNKNTSLDVARSIAKTIDKKGLNTGARLVDNKLLINDLSKQIDKWVAATRLRKPGNFMDKKYLKDSINEHYFKNESMSKFSKEQLGTWLLEEERARLEGNLHNQFNVNPDLSYKKNGYVLGLKGTDKAGTIHVYDPVAKSHKEIQLYFVRNEDLTIMQQNEVLISTKPTEFEKGKTKLKAPLKFDKKEGRSYIKVNGEKIYVDSKNTGMMDLYVKPERMMNTKLNGYRQSSVDMSFSTMLTRNRSWTEGKKVKERLRLEQIQIGLDSGVIITAEKYMQSTTNKDLYQKMGEPVTEQGRPIKVKNRNKDILGKYGDLYYEKRFLADIEGTVGIRLDKRINKLFGPGAGKVITEFIRSMMGMRDFAKQTILVYSPAGWINSALSSMSIYMTHADPGSMIKDRADALRAISEFKVASERYSKAVASARDSKAGTRQQKIDEARKALESTELYDAMKLGISTTIRSDAFINNTYKRNPIVQQINDFTGNEYVGELIETVQADPTSRWGKKIGTYYDQLEVMPKMMLYFNKKRKYKSSIKAAQYAMMANPHYARNLPGLFNAIDQVSPYTKYMISFPTMAIYAAKQNPGKLATMITAYQTMMYMSWHTTGQELNDREQQMYSDGYMKIPGFDEAKFMQSAFAWNIPTKGFNDMSIADLDFMGEVPEHFINPLSAFKLTTDINDR